MNHSIKILEETKNILSKGWVKYYFAANDKGESVAYDDPTACKYCLLAATWMATKNTNIGFNSGYYDQVLNSLFKTLPLDPKEGITEFNDKQENVEQILEALDKAIDYLKK